MRGAKIMNGGRRRVAAGVVALVFGSIGLAQCDQSDDPRPTTDRLRRLPNVLIVLTDDQPLRGTMEVMPKTRRIFEEGGTSYPMAFATTPQCCPARATILSGRYAHNNGVRHNYQAHKLDQDTTIERHLQDLGYKTALFGKFLNGWPIDRSPPHFDQWATVKSRSDYHRALWNVNGDVEEIEVYSTDYVFSQAESFLQDRERDDARPWFVVISTRAPHAPYTPSSTYEDAAVPPWQPTPAESERNFDDKPSFIPRFVRRGVYPQSEIAEVRAAQLRTLLTVDDLVETLFERIGELDEDRRTLAFFMSDNGYTWHEHGLGGPRYGKRTAYDGSARIPLYLRWPGRIPAGQRERSPVGTVDIAPTIFDAVGGLTPNPRLDGRSLLRDAKRREILLEHWGDNRSEIPTWASLRSNSYLYVEYYEGGKVIFREFYDLTEDPWMLDNVLGDEDAGNDPPVVDRLSKRLDEYRSCSGRSCP